MSDHRSAPDTLDLRGTADRLWTWMQSDPKNFVFAVTMPLSVWETISQMRWQRAHGRGALSLGGAAAYARARPVRFAYSVALSVLPNAVDMVNRRRQQERPHG